MKHLSVYRICLIFLACLLALSSTTARADPGPTVYVPIVAGPPATPGGSAPAIRSFVAAPSTVAAGAASTLTWAVSGATGLSISPGPGAVTGGSVSVSPAKTTEYVLTATNAHGSSTAKVTVTVQPAEPQPEEAGATWLPFNTAPDGVLHTRGSSVAVDSQGGVHTAYVVRVGLDQGTRPAYYAYCPSECSRQANWTRVALSVNEWVGDVRLALDAAGRPRMMLYSNPPTDDEGLAHYTYAVCNSQCTNGANWTLTLVAVARLIESSRPDYVFRYFALDPQGHPAFFYTDGSQGIDHNGTYYATCPADPSGCSDAANWVETKISPYWLSTPSLAFSPSGQPRAAFYFFHEDNEVITNRLLYLACDANCQDAANWQGIFMNDLHGTSRFSLRVDKEGRPRMILFSGAYPDPFFQANRLYYLHCNTNCTLAGQSGWDAHDIGLNKYYGQDADLVLDGQGRPRIAYDSFGSGLGFAWCNTDCESNAAVWQHQMAEPSSTLESDFPVAPTRRCSVSTWVTGQDPMLALDADGNPRVAYVAEHGYGGTNLDKPWETCPTFTDIVLARFMAFPHP